MTPEELEQAILDTILKTYHKQYVGKIKCIPITGGWTVILGLHENKPLTIEIETGILYIGILDIRYQMMGVL